MLGFVLLIVGLFLLAQVIGGLIIGIYIGLVNMLNMFLGIQFDPVQIEQQILSLTIYGAIIGGVIALFFFWIVHLIRIAVVKSKESFVRFCGFRRTSAPHLIAAFFAGISFNFILLGLMYFSRLPEYFPEHQELMEIIFGHHILVTFLAVGIMASLVEEVGFRGIIFNRLRKGAPLTAALLVQAFFFGLAHLNVLQSGYAFFMGILLGLVYLWTGSVWGPIITHLSSNTTSIMMVQVIQMEQTGPRMLALIILGVIVLAACVLFFIKNNRVETLQEI